VGRAKDEMMRYEEEAPMREWIEDNYGCDIEEDSQEWEEAIEAYDHHCEQQYQLEEDNYWQAEFEWFLESKTQIGIFNNQIGSVDTLLDTDVDTNTQFSLFVMLHAHVVAAVEAYLASTFIHTVTGSDELIRKLVETDPDFSEMKFSLKEIFERHEGLKLTVAAHLKKLIFHRLNKIKPMYKNVLNHDFGDVTWLIHAIQVRHHCVHRAGFDTEGEKVQLTVRSIRQLISNAQLLVSFVESHVNPAEIRR